MSGLVTCTVVLVLVLWCSMCPIWYMDQTTYEYELLPSRVAGASRSRLSRRSLRCHALRARAPPATRSGSGARANSYSYPTPAALAHAHSARRGLALSAGARVTLAPATCELWGFYEARCARHAPPVGGVIT